MIRHAALCALVCVGFLTGCARDAQQGFATRRDIVEAAARCGVPDFKPTRAGANWAAYVRPPVHDHQAKEDCIYQDIRGAGPEHHALARQASNRASGNTGCTGQEVRLTSPRNRLPACRRSRGGRWPTGRRGRRGRGSAGPSSPPRCAPGWSRRPWPTSAHRTGSRRR